MLVVDFSKIQTRDEQPNLVLRSMDEQIVGVLSDAFNIKLQLSYNDVSELTFVLPIISPYFYKIYGNMYIDAGAYGQFILSSPKLNTDGIRNIKECTAYSREYELTQKQFFLSSGTYQFWSPAGQESLMGMVMESIPGWGLGTISPSLSTKYRTFDETSTNLYDFLMNTVQKTYGVCFVFDNVSRTISATDIYADTDILPIYLSFDNLLKEATVEELTSDVVTCLNVSGADGVDIRSANPTGNNTIYCLDYYFSKEDANQNLKEKWAAWKLNLNTYKDLYYSVGIQRNVITASILSNKAKLTDLQSEYQVLQISYSVIFSGISAGLKSESDLEIVNQQMQQKQAEIVVQNEYIQRLQAEYDSFTEQLQSINQNTAFNKFFTDHELILLHNYFKEDSFQDSTFVASSVDSYSTPDITASFSGGTLYITNSKISKSTFSKETFYDISGGHLEISGNKFALSASAVHAVFQINSETSDIVFTAYLLDCQANTSKYASGTVALSGTGVLSASEFSLTLSASQLNAYFTGNVTEYQTQSIERELYDFAMATLQKVSEPSYVFTVESGNIVFAKEFEPFKDALRLGSAVYLQISDEYFVTPVLTGIEIDYEDPTSFSLTFANKFRQSSTVVGIEDVIKDASYSSKTTSYNKYNYSDFVNSGAKSQVKQFMNSALDFSKNSLFSSTNMNITMDGTGLHLRKLLDDGKYDPFEIWGVNNSLVFSDDNFQSTPKLALGTFYDPNIGTTTGIVGQSIVGTLIAGQSLVIESEKQFGGIAQVKIDSNGAQFNNARIVQTTDGAVKTQALLDSSVGFAMGTYPLFEKSQTTDEITLLKENAKLYFDTNGEAVFKGTVYAAAGEFTGTVNANSGIFKGTVQASRYLDSSGNNMFDDDTNKFKSDYLNLKGIKVTNTSGTTTFSVSSSGSVSLNGDITMNGGSINWSQINGDPEIQDVKEIANRAQQSADSAAGVAAAASNNAASAYGQAESAWNTAMALADGNLSGHTFIDGKTIKSPEIIGGRIVSETTIDVGTDVHIGNNLYMMEYGGSTGSINFSGVGTIQLSQSRYEVPALAVNTPGSSFIEISTGDRVLGSYDTPYVFGDVIIRAMNNVRIGTKSGYGGKIYLNGHSFDYDNGTLLIDGSPYAGGGSNVAVFA